MEFMKLLYKVYTKNTSKLYIAPPIIKRAPRVSGIELGTSMISLFSFIQ